MLAEKASESCVAVVPILPISPVVAPESHPCLLSRMKLATIVTESTSPMFGRKTTTPWFYETSSQKEALGRLTYLIESGEGFAALHGPRGAGRTTLLRRLQDRLQRQQVAAVLINAATLDPESLLSHIADAFSLVWSGGFRSSDRRLQIKDELLGRAHCGIRTVILLDDIQLGGRELPVALQYLKSLASASDGMVTVVAASDVPRIPGLTENPSLNIMLPLLSSEESQDFVLSLLGRQVGGLSGVDRSAVTAIAELSGGLPARLKRFCELLQLVRETTPGMKIDARVIHEIGWELIPRAVA